MNWEAPPKAAELAETRVITAILDGHFPIGDNLPAERELADQLGVTRPTLREALQRMARDGWIEIHHGRPTRVRDYWKEGNLGVLSTIARFPDHAPADFVPNLLAIRYLMAPAYVRQAAEQAPGELAELLQDLATVEDHPSTFAQIDWLLHHRATIWSGNPIFTLILNGFEELYRTMAVVYFSREESRAHSKKFYAELLKAVQAQEPEAVEEITRLTMAESQVLWQAAIAVNLVE